MTAQQYHGLTSYQRKSMPAHFLDWQNQPSVFKTYPEAVYVQLPEDIRHGEQSLFSILKSPISAEIPHAPDLTDLSKIFALAYCITGKGGHGGGYHYYRSVASAGALYPTEIYVSIKDVQGLDDGLYHFSITNHALTPLRKGDMSAFVANSIFPSLENPPAVTFFLSAIFFRSAWKYLARSYRYHLMDTGHLLENLVVSIKAQNFPSAVSFDFDDHALNRFLGLDETKEVCLAVCYVPGEHQFEKTHTGEEITELPLPIKNASIVSRNEKEYEPVFEIHAQGMLEGARLMAQIPVIDPVNIKSEKTVDITRSEIWPEKLNYAESFLYRRSKRNYVPKPMHFNQLAALVQSLSINGHGASSDERNYQNTVRTGLVVGNVQGIDPGFYLLDKPKGSLNLINSGRFTDVMAHICLNQKWLENAAAHFIFLTDIEILDKYCGARGYRYAMMVAGRMGERLYLTTTAMGLGCCGIGAFYDTEAAQLLSLNSASRLLYLVAVGPIKKV